MRQWRTTQFRQPRLSQTPCAPTCAMRQFSIRKPVTPSPKTAASRMFCALCAFGAPVSGMIHAPCSKARPSNATSLTKSPFSGSPAKRTKPGATGATARVAATVSPGRGMYRSSPALRSWNHSPGASSARRRFSKAKRGRVELQKKSGRPAGVFAMTRPDFPST